MSDSVKFIFVNATEGIHDAELYAVTIQKQSYRLPNVIKDGISARNDLSQLEGFPTGTEFQIMIDTEMAQRTADQTLTYDQASFSTGNFKAENTPLNPFFTFVDIQKS